MNNIRISQELFPASMICLGVNALARLLATAFSDEVQVHNCGVFQVGLLRRHHAVVVEIGVIFFLSFFPFLVFFNIICFFVPMYM
jgi:hypothetical protein